MDSNSHSDSNGRSGRTLSTRVEPELRQRIDNRCRAAGESKSAFLRRLLRMYEASVDGRLKCDHCGKAVRLER